MFPLLFISLWLRTHSASGSQSGAASERFCDGQNCYAVQWGHVSFGEAADMCRRREGVLTSMRSPREADSIRRLLLSAPGAEYPLSLWIGLRKGAKTCSSPEGRLRGYAWLSGDAASNYSAWAREPPTTCTHELCVSLEVRLERHKEQFRVLTMLTILFNDDQDFQAVSKY
uniref:C-type lectin domain-containing protein n=1 Tax=Callorhinchus milii TaxID=7868 RepID=A0A4W3H1K5_CALMI